MGENETSLHRRTVCLLDGECLDGDLPWGWEEKTTEDGTVFYVNHRDRSTHWIHPRAQAKRVYQDLPYGWTEEPSTDSSPTSFVDHISGKKSYCDPRLIPNESQKNKKKAKIGASTTAMELLEGKSLAGQYAVITGANSGIGFETARALAVHGAHVVIACRDMVASQTAIEKIRKQKCEALVEAIHIDLASLRSVKAFTDEYKHRQWPLHLLVCNAAVFGIPYTLSEDGLEMNFAVNHLGHFYLTWLLQDVLVSSRPSRVVVVSSESHRFHSLSRDQSLDFDLLPMPKSKYWPILAYGQSKLCNVLFAAELNRRLAEHGVKSYSLHPGNMIHTGLSRHSCFYRLIFFLARPFTKSKEQGAATTVYCTTFCDPDDIGGDYFIDCTKHNPSPEAERPEVAKQLWELSEQLIQDKMQPLKLQ